MNLTEVKLPQLICDMQSKMKNETMLLSQRSENDGGVLNISFQVQDLPNESNMNDSHKMKKSMKREMSTFVNIQEGRQRRKKLYENILKGSSGQTFSSGSKTERIQKEWQQLTDEVSNMKDNIIEFHIVNNERSMDLAIRGFSDSQIQHIIQLFRMKELPASCQ